MGLRERERNGPEGIRRPGTGLAGADGCSVRGGRECVWGGHTCPQYGGPSPSLGAAFARAGPAPPVRLGTTGSWVRPWGREGLRPRRRDRGSHRVAVCPVPACVTAACRADGPLRGRKCERKGRGADGR